HFVERAVARLALDDDALALASDRQRQLLALEAGHGDDARHGEEVGHVLAVVDLVEDRLFGDRKSTRLNSSHCSISYAVFCLKKKKKKSFLAFLGGAKARMRKSWYM